jgi:nucleotide-binding universal stress UspA family protein
MGFEDFVMKEAEPMYRRRLLPLGGVDRSTQALSPAKQCGAELAVRKVLPPAPPAEGNAVDLIVMPAGRLSGLARWPGNSFADRVAREARIPDLLVRVSNSRRHSV